MTIASVTNRESFACNGVTVAFSFPHKFLADKDLVVTLVTEADGTETTLTLNTHYTVTGAGLDAGGTVTTTTAYSSAYTLVVVRQLAVTQETDFVENDALPVEDVETALDRLTMIAQQQQEELDRSIKFSIGVDVTEGNTTLPIPADLAGMYVAFDASGNLVPASGTGADAGLRTDIAAPSGSSLVGHIGPEGGEIESDVETRLNDWISATRFMTAAQIADVKARTKTLDVTAALAAAHATGKPVRYPTGTYRVDGSLGSEGSPLVDFTMIGEGEEDTIIDLTNNTTFFAAVEYRHVVEKVLFTRNHVANSGDVFRRKNSTDQGYCKFHMVSARSIGGAFLKLFGAGNGSKISFDKFTYVSLYNSGTGYAGKLFDSATNSIATDSLSLNDCWIESINDVTIDAYNLGRLSITGCTRLIPYTNPTQGFWIKTTGYSPHVYISGTDFGGESVRRVFDWRGTGGDIQIDDAGIFCAARGVFTFTNAVPDFINLKGITGLVDTFGLIKVVSATNADKLAWSKCPISIGSNQAPVELYFADFNGDTVVLSQAANSLNQHKEGVVSTSDLITTSGSSWVASGSLSSVTEAIGASAPDIFGNDSFGFKFTATADGGSFSKTLNAAFGTIPDGPATLEALVTVTGSPMVYSLLVGSVRKTFILAPGNHFLCLPAIVTPSLARTLGIEGTFMRSGDTCSTNRIRLWAGQFNRRQREILATAAPGAGTIWFKNDRLITAAPTVGQPKGWFCTVSGDPATFVSEGNL